MTSWRVLPPARVYEVIEYWALGPWPQTFADIARRSGELGWVVEEEVGREWIYNRADGLSEQLVSVVALPDGGDVIHVGWDVTDLERPGTPESIAWMNDQYVLLQREATSRWGPAGTLNRTELGLRQASGPSRIMRSSLCEARPSG